MLRLDNQPRVFRLIDEAIERFDLRLDGLRVLTEAASGAYVVTALAAARAGARVRAIARDSVHGDAGSVIAYGREWAEALGVADRIDYTTGPAAACAADADIVTNLGFVRPIDRALVGRLPPHAVIALMWEPWELRPGEIDLEACAAAGIPVVGTNERDPRLRTFDYVGILAVKLLLEAGVEVFRSRVVVIGSDPFGAEVAAKLAALGADVARVGMPAAGQGLDGVVGGQIERADALVLAEHRDRRELVGNAGGVRPMRLLTGGCRLIHIAGNVDRAALAAARVVKHPVRDTAPGFMVAGTDHVGARPVIDLHTAGLQVGAIAVRCRKAGGSAAEAIAAAEASGLGVSLERTW